MLPTGTGATRVGEGGEGEEGVFGGDSFLMCEGVRVWVRIRMVGEWARAK